MVANFFSQDPITQNRTGYPTGTIYIALRDIDYKTVRLNLLFRRTFCQSSSLLGLFQNVQ